MRLVRAIGGLAAAVIFTVVFGSAGSAFSREPFHWHTVVNNGDLIPGTDTSFNSYNQPSVNRYGLVVFRARSAGGDGGGAGAVSAAVGTPIHGIFERDMAKSGPIIKLADKVTLVPDPNNLESQFNEFPAFPRIAYKSTTIGFRGNSQPVWEYALPDGSDTRAGTAGLYCQFKPKSKLFTGMQVLGAVPGFEYFEVPGASTTGIKFDVFPGAPAVTHRYVVFKGNYTDNGESQTGVYYRDLRKKGNPPAYLIANTSTLIPNQPAGGTVTFGSTAPPSAMDGQMVFLGLDNEDAPTLGGIYFAPLKANTSLTTLVGLNTPVPGVSQATFNRLGEGLSYSLKRYVGFWGAWGDETRNVHLVCPTDGNQDLIAYCNMNYPDGYDAQVPVNQGIFVYDRKKHKSVMIAETGQDNFLDFTYWVFSGRPPGVGGGEPEGYEPPRWRQSSFVAVGNAAVAFKGTKEDGVDGVYVSKLSAPDVTNHLVAIDTTMAGDAIDPDAPAGVQITSVGVERDGFRGRWLSVVAGMANADASVTWGGIYVSRRTNP